MIERHCLTDEKEAPDGNIPSLGTAEIRFSMLEDKKMRRRLSRDEKADMDFWKDYLTINNIDLTRENTKRILAA